MTSMWRTQFIARILALAIVLALTIPASAHDFWLMPSAFRARANAPVPIAIGVGDTFPGEAFARHDLRIERFVAIDLSKQPIELKGVPIPGEDGKQPVGVFTPESPGLYLIAYRGKATFIQIEAEKFEAYLQEKGLKEIADARAKAGETKTAGKEKYSRCCKSLIRVSAESDAAHAERIASKGYDQAIGLRLEIIPLTDPFADMPFDGLGKAMKVRILFDEKPLANAKVYARLLIAPTTPPADAIEATTDDAGEATLSLPKAGAWLVATVAMTRAPTTAPVTARSTTAPGSPVHLFVPDWESTWSSLTFNNSND